MRTWSIESVVVEAIAAAAVAVQAAIDGVTSLLKGDPFAPAGDTHPIPGCPEAKSCREFGCAGDCSEAQDAEGTFGCATCGGNGCEDCRDACVRCGHHPDTHHPVGGIIDPCSFIDCDCDDLDLTGWSLEFSPSAVGEPPLETVHTVSGEGGEVRAHSPEPTFPHLTSHELWEAAHCIESHADLCVNHEKTRERLWGLADGLHAMSRELRTQESAASGRFGDSDVDAAEAQ